MRRRSPGAGFTLVELIVVLAVIGFGATLAPAAFSRLHAAQEYRSDVRAVQQALKTARLESFRTGVPVALEVDLDARVMLLGNAVAARVSEGTEMRLVAAALEGGQPRRGVIVFYPQGGASGGSIELVRDGGQGIRLRVDWLLGRVERQPLFPS